MMPWWVGAAESFGSRHELVLVLLATCIVLNMPRPGTKIDWAALYAWFYASLQAFWASRHPSAPGVATDPKE